MVSAPRWNGTNSTMARVFMTIGPASIQSSIASVFTMMLMVVITILAWGVGSIIYIFVGLGTFAGVTSSKETKLLPVLFRAAIGGAVGAALGGWIAILIGASGF